MNSLNSHEKGDPARFEELCEQGLEAAEDMDKGRWKIGDLALEVKKVYGRDRVGQFATRINVKKTRVQEYRGMSVFYPESLRQQIFEQYPPGLITYTHLRTARRLKDPAAIIAFIDECASNAWTSEVADVTLSKRIGKPVPPEKILDGLGLVIGLRGDIVTLRVDSELTTALYDAMRAKTPVSIVIRPSEETPDFRPASAVILGSGYDRRVDTRLVAKVS